MSNNGNLLIKQHYSKSFADVMGWNFGVTKYYGAVSESNLKFSFCLSEEIVMMQILYCFHLLIQIEKLEVGPSEAPLKYSDGLSTTDAFMIDAYKSDIEFAHEKCEYRIKYTDDNVMIRPNGINDIEIEDE